MIKDLSFKVLGNLQAIFVEAGRNTKNTNTFTKESEPVLSKK